MQLLSVETFSKGSISFLDFKIPAGFSSPTTDYVETRINFNDLMIQNPAFTFFAYAEGDSMTPDIQDGNLLVIDRKSTRVSY